MYNHGDFTSFVYLLFCHCQELSAQHPKMGSLLSDLGLSRIFLKVVP